MTKKFISKLVVFLLSAVLLIPATLSLPTVKADEDTTIDAYPGVEFSFEVTDEDIVKKGQSVVITANDGEKDVELFKNGAPVKVEDENPTYFFSSYTKGKVTARITKPKLDGYYTFTVTTIAGEGETAKEFKQKVKVHDDVSKLKAPSYKYLSGTSEDLAKLEEYELRAQEVSQKGEGENKRSLYVDETYTVQSVEDLVDLGSFSYEQYRKTVNYAVPGSSSYSSSSASGASDMTFTITKVGTYRFYVLLSIDEIDGKSFDISVNKLKEYHDGFYSIEKSDGTPLYMNGNKYYTDEKFENEYVPADEEVDVVQSKLIVPIFEFTIENAGPNVKITSTYQENGYVGLQYEITGIKVSGNEVSTSYALKYRESDGSNWVDATETFDADTMTFTPEKQGQYKLVVTAIDSDGKVNSPAETKVIKVEQKYETVDYKTGFNDWISVNYVPFIFLCISGVCLIAIILLLVIKPKDATKKVKVEEDK